MLESTLNRALASVLPEPMLLVTAEGNILEGNAAAQRLFPLVAEKNHLGDWATDDAGKLQSSLRLWARSGNMIRGLISLIASDGTVYTVYGARVPPVEGEPPRLLLRCQVARSVNEQFIALTQRNHALNREIARRQHTEASLFAEKERAQVTLKSIGDAVITTDTEGRVDYLNPVAETLTGWSLSEAQGHPLPSIFHIYNEKTREPVANPVARVLAHGKTIGLANQTVLVRRDGTEFAIADSAAPIRDRSGQLTGVVLVFHDVTQARRLAAKVSHQASHDSLTGLLNRQAFEQRLRSLLEAPGAMETSHSLLYLDLDQFKIINDTCGHLAGDALLHALGPLLQSCLRHSDLLARLGGDEFGILLQDCPESVARRIAKSLQKVVMEFNFIWEGKPFNIGVSIGQVNFSDNSRTLVELLSAADNACYMAKDNGRNRVYVYGTNDQEMAYRHQQTQWVGRLQEAFNEDRFHLYYQEITPVSPSSSAGSATAEGHFELLLRLRDSHGKLIPPMAFIPAAERYNLMVMIDQWVIDAAFGKLALADCKGVTTCAINLSGASLGDEKFLGFVRACFQRYRIPPELICFEITETAAIANLANARHIIQELKVLGCRFALDDFGSGMSSFGYLKNLPVDYLKIDGLFVKDMVEDPIDHSMVAAINHIGHVMGLETIAEFVETPPILQELRLLGVNYAQGYGISRPQPFESLLAKLAG